MQVNQESSKVLSTPGHLISLAARGFARMSDERLKPLGFGLGYVPVLVALWNKQAVSQRDLAKLNRVEQPSMAQMLARMERDGLICRTPDPADGRSSRVSLTKAAMSSLPAACATLMKGNQDALVGFTDEEVTQLATLLNRLIANLDNAACPEE